MSRLLHAAARGARIDVFHQCKWVSAIAVRTVDDLYNYRIHPDDAHLQYGPISTALREIALTGDCADADIPYIRVTMAREDGYWESTADQRRVFCLILAEALADSGL